MQQAYGSVKTLELSSLGDGPWGTLSSPFQQVSLHPLTAHHLLLAKAPKTEAAPTGVSVTLSTAYKLGQARVPSRVLSLPQVCRFY